ncbi:MAG: CYTH domain-containing protein [Mariniphaga sp.]
MGIEIERKYLITNDNWRSLGVPVHYVQGYLVSDDIRTVRIRIAGDNGFLTIKGKSNSFSRAEFEYSVPANDAKELLKLCDTPVIEKYRTKVLYGGKIWEIDEFEGQNKGLIVAEIEILSEDEVFLIPPWIGEEVTGDLRYFNSRLAVCPFQNW